MDTLEAIILGEVQVLTEFLPISARVVANRASFQFKRREMETLLSKLTEVTGT